MQCGEYLHLLERKHLRVQVISRSKEPDGVTLHLRRECTTAIPWKII